MTYLRLSVLICLLTALWAARHGEIPPGFRTHTVPRTGEAGPEPGTISYMTKQLASQVAAYKLWRVGRVTEVSRRGFSAEIGLREGIEPGADAEVFRHGNSGEILVARAKVIETRKDTSRVRRADRVRKLKIKLRRTDRERNLRIRKNDSVRIIAGIRLMMGGIGGVPKEIGDMLGSKISTSLRDDHGLHVQHGPDAGPAGPWPWEAPDELCRAADAGYCSHALAGWAEVRGDTIRVVLGLIDVANRKTVELYSGTVDSDPAIASLVEGTGPHHTGPGEAPPTGTDQDGAGGSELGGSEPYETRLQAAFTALSEESIIAVHVLEDHKYICCVYDCSLSVRDIGPDGYDLLRVTTCVIEPPPRRVPCRDAIATTALLDSDGDGSKELVVWSSLLAGPAAFSAKKGLGTASIVLERAETYWLPWTDPLGDGRYVEGRNHLTCPAALDGTPYHSWKTGDLTGDGTPEVVLAELDGSVTVRDTSMAVISRLPHAGPPLDICDMNGDGLMELIVTSSGPGDANNVLFYDWNGVGFETVWKSQSFGFDVLSLAAGLVDADDLPDLIVLGRGERDLNRSHVQYFTTSR